jgi:hypothetical protein
VELSPRTLSKMALMSPPTQNVRDQQSLVLSPYSLRNTFHVLIQLTADSELPHPRSGEQPV